MPRGALVSTCNVNNREGDVAPVASRKAPVQSGAWRKSVSQWASRKTAKMHLVGRPHIIPLYCLIWLAR